MRRGVGQVQRDLSVYRKKRRANKTPEPMPAAGSDAAEPVHGDPRFVIQEHHARSLHWDLRLERDGVLVSWAVPKGLPPEPGQQRLAVHTEDHPMEYATFSGRIPRGEYGGGDMYIWDSGTYQTVKWDDGHVEVVLQGARVRGQYLLIRTDKNQWLLRRRDAPTDPGWQTAPGHVEPMLATAGELPTGRHAVEWGYEFKWDGVRALVRVEGGRPQAWGRNRTDITPRYPELRAFAAALGSTQLIVDGELVAFGQDGRPSFGALQHRMHLENEREIRRTAAEVPASYLIFDLLHLDGRSHLDTPYRERRELLDSLELRGPQWLVPPYYVDGSDTGLGAAVTQASREQRLEGVVAKRLASLYRPGRRSLDWIKVPNLTTQEVVIGGWREGTGQLRGSIGALLLGVYGSATDEFRYVGDVGTGFSYRARADLVGRLSALNRETSPFANEVPADRARGAHWVRPTLVGEVLYRNLTDDNRLRHSVWRGLRSDKQPKQVRGTWDDTREDE
jgi:bifunctional non-homologous end joining protein LigD